MSKSVDRLKKVAGLVRSGKASEVAKLVRRRVYSDSLYYGLRRDLAVPFEPPKAKIPLLVRRMVDADVPKLLDVHAPGLTKAAISERLVRLNFLEAGIGDAYVATTLEGEPCYMQCLITARDNDRFQAFYEGDFPVLGQDEALLEHAFTLESYQGLGIMSSAMAQIAEKGADLGARWVITLVGVDNIPSLKGCKKAGFSPYFLWHRRCSLLRCTVDVKFLPSGTPYPFDRVLPAA